MLQRTSQVGEYYVMGPPTIPLTEADETTINFLDIVIFDEESDRHIVLPWEDAVAASFCTMNGAALGMASVGENIIVKRGAGLAAPAAAAYLGGNAANGFLNGNVITAANPGGAVAVQARALANVPGAGNNNPTADLRACEWRDLANCWRIIAKFGVNHDFGNGDAFFPATDAECALATNNGGGANDMFTISDRFRGRSMRKFMQVPEFRVYCVVARPFIEHMMMSAIMTVSGRDTGAMLFGPSDMQISANTQVKTIEG
jgi:hypothetical protein